MALRQRDASIATTALAAVALESDEERVSTMALGERLHVGWAHQMRHREGPARDRGQLRWYREETPTYRFTAGYVMPAILKSLAHVTIEGLENVPATGPVILAANHRDNLDAYLLIRLVPRMVHFAARPDAFGTGPLCALWRRLGAFPADAWGVRHALTLLSDGGVVAIFPQAMISRELREASAAVGLLALRSGAPVVPVAISGTDAVHAVCAFTTRAPVVVRFGAPMTFARNGSCSPRSQTVADEILRDVGLLLEGATLGRV